MRYIPRRVSEEQLPWVQVTPHRPHNSVNLPRHYLYNTLHLLLGGDSLGHLYIHYTAMVTTVKGIQRNRGEFKQSRINTESEGGTK